MTGEVFAATVGIGQGMLEAGAAVVGRLDGVGVDAVD